MCHPEAAMWMELAEAEAQGNASIGNKAARLAELRRAGFLVPESWVLPAGQLATGSRDSAARQLVRLRPGTAAWILRSSSPLEDRPGASAAGLFRSEVSGPSIHELSEALRRVDEGRRLTHVRELLADDAPLAVLAQPLLALRAWYTVELRPGREAEVEGWPRGGRPPEEFLQRLRSQEPGAAVLAELGRAEGEWFVLQLRPAPDRPLPTRAPASGEPIEIDESRWRWDRAHATRPLCPLLAGYFEAWLSRQEEPASRLYHGCWYDRQPPERPPFDDEARRQLGNLEALERRLQEADAAASEIRGGEDWRAFMAAWMRFQEAYFARPTAAARQWLRSQPHEPATRGRIFEEREHALDDLARRMASGEELELAAFLRSHGHHADWPWDGRGRSWSEDPGALRRELRIRGERAPTRREAGQQDSEITRVARILEDDDELLARAYALFRSALRRAANSAGIADGRWEDCLELSPAEWERLLDQFDLDRWEHAVARGRRLARAWLGQTLLRASKSSDILRGIPVVEGHVRAPLRVLPSACAGGGPEWGEILVVPSIQPSDAVVFPRLAGLVVESGDALGHAAVLAREAKVPAIVDVHGACVRLAAIESATLDASAGVLQIADFPSGL